MLALIVVAMLVQPRSNILGQDESRSPQIEISRAVFGTGRGKGVCTDQVKRIIQNKNADTEISTPGLGLRNPSGQFRDLLYIWYRVDGIESRLTLENGKTVNIYAAILEHAATVSETEDSATEDTGSAAVRPTEMKSIGETSETDPNSIRREEFIDREKLIENNLATVVGLFIDEHDNGQQFGVTVDIIAQASRERGAAVNFQRPQGIGKEMRISMEEAERAIRARYPKWENGIIRLSFGNKYSNKDGGSSGAAFALLILSLLEGFEIDSDAAITGDILANWKVVGVGAVPEKIHCAVLDR